jgi:hypothetical protein
MARMPAQAVVVMVLVGALQAAAPASASEVATIVLHVRDFQGVPPNELADAQRGASEIYGHIGVHLVWTDGSARLDAVDRRLNIDIVILDAAMADRNNPDPAAFGQASHATGRAYIYYSRVASFVRRTHSNPDRALALVLAHELGHVLLPENSHTDAGIMRPTLSGPVFTLPRFAPAQAMTIRSAVLRAGLTD